MDRGKMYRHRDWRGIGMKGMILLPLALGALLGVTQALILLCVVAFIFAPL